MSELKVATRNNQTAFRPGEQINGAAGWQLDKPAEWAEIRLFWYTEGKGTQDVEIVDQLRFEKPQREEARPFSFVAPAAPVSFSGKLISLLWALELVIESGSESGRLNLVISPSGEELLLHDYESA